MPKPLLHEKVVRVLSDARRHHESEAASFRRFDPEGSEDQIYAHEGHAGELRECISTGVLNETGLSVIGKKIDEIRDRTKQEKGSRFKVVDSNGKITDVTMKKRRDNARLLRLLEAALPKK